MAAPSAVEATARMASGPMPSQSPAAMSPAGLVAARTARVTSPPTTPVDAAIMSLWLRATS